MSCNHSYKSKTKEKQIFFLLILLFFNINFTIAQNSQLSFSTGASVNVNDFQWSIAGNTQGQSPNILSELIFKKVTSLGIYLEGTYRPFKFFEINSFYQKNGVISGNGFDADYNGDNRTNPTYNEPFLSNKGELEIFRLGVNLFFVHKGNFHLGTGVFYASTIQNLYILNSDFENLKSTYKVKCRGPRFSLNGNYEINKKLSIRGSLSYCFIKYNAEANWNLIDEFMHPLSFDQHSKGRNTDGEIGFSYKINSLFALTINGVIANAKSFKGIDKSYLKTNTQILTQFNGSNSTFYAFRIGTNIVFFNHCSIPSQKI